MNKKTLFVGSVTAFAVTVLGAIAGCGQANSADVVAVKPISKTVKVPREECRDEVVTQTRPTRDPNQIAGTVAGAVIGGVLGNQVGSGRGKDLATVGGAVAGGYAGNKVQEGVQKRNTEQTTQRICQTVYDSREEAAGFDVTYRFNGQERTVHMDYDPGSSIPVENGAPVLRK